MGFPYAEQNPNIVLKENMYVRTAKKCLNKPSRTTSNFAIVVAA